MAISIIPQWLHLSDEQLLDMRFCDLKLNLKNTPLQARVDRLYQELRRRNLRFKPHCWLAEEWFSPDEAPGIALPFYLAHPRLSKLEARQMYEVEGGTDRWCMQLLRHEAGHAIDTAYRLHRRKHWRQIFGDYKKPYPDFYTPKPQSKNYVLHLEWWYAQSHPAEDFAETFAVWLRPRARWRKDYANWPALKKLQYVDQLMDSIEYKPALQKSKKQIEPLSRIRKTLREHYAEKRLRYGIHVPEVYDKDLQRLFSDEPGNASRKKTAAAFLRRVSSELCQVCAQGTGEHPYVIAQVLQAVIIRCREMKLYIVRPEEQVKVELAVFLSVQILNYFHKTHHKVPV